MCVKMSGEEETDELLQLNNEIQSLYDYCLASGLTHEEIVEKAKPLLRPLQKEEWKKILLVLLKMSICCIALSYTLASDTVARPMLSNGRQLMFKILPYWDWTKLYLESCLLDNPFYLNEVKHYYDCHACEDVFAIEYKNKTSTEEISQYHMQRHIPVIVSNAMHEWPVMHDSFNIVNLTEGFYDLEEDICMFQSNLGVANHHDVFQKIMNEDQRSWYAHWENCNKNSQKMMRQFYARPYFLPSVVQMTEPNWILMSSGYMGQKFKQIEVITSNTIMWIAQIRGYNNIQLVPKVPCDSMCNVLEDTIEEGEIVLFSPAVWNFSYLPGEGTENLALAAGGFSNFD